MLEHEILEAGGLNMFRKSTEPDAFLKLVDQRMKELEVSIFSSPLASIGGHRLRVESWVCVLTTRGLYAFEGLLVLCALSDDEVDAGYYGESVRHDFASPTSFLLNTYSINASVDGKVYIES